MKIVRYADADFAERLRELTRVPVCSIPSSNSAPAKSSNAVKLRGDVALSEFTERFDGAKLAPEQFAVTHAELMAASLKADERFAKSRC